MSIPSRFCPNCGKPVLAEAKFCPACGATIPAQQATPQAPPQAPLTPAYPSYGPSYQTPYQQPYQQQPPAKSNTKIIIAVVIIIVVVVAGLGTYAAYSFFNNLPSITTQKSLAIANGNYAVPAGHYYYLTFVLPVSAYLISVNGTFSTSGRIRTMVMDSTNFGTFQSNGMGTFYYDSGSTTSGTVLATLPGSGTYDLVYLNTLGANETVNTVVTVYYR
jgi:hypothetical protein